MSKQLCEKCGEPMVRAHVRWKKETVDAIYCQWCFYIKDPNKELKWNIESTGGEVIAKRGKMS